MKRKTYPKVMKSDQTKIEKLNGSQIKCMEWEKMMTKIFHSKSNLKLQGTQFKIASSKLHCLLSTSIIANFTIKSETMGAKLISIQTLNCSNHLQSSAPVKKMDYQ